VIFYFAILRQVARFSNSHLQESWALGHAVLIYDLARSIYPSTYRVTIDAQTRDVSPATRLAPLLFPDDPLHCQDNPLGTSRTLLFDNNNETGFIGLHYIEIVNVAGGSS
jgi:hypothetical protein